MKQMKLKLYKACKHEFHEYHADCGYTLCELWHIVNDKPDSFEAFDRQTFWIDTVLEDYEHDVLNTSAKDKFCQMKRILNSIHKHIQGERLEYWFYEIVRKYRPDFE